MVDRKALLSDLQKLLKQLENDIRERLREDVERDEHLRGEYEKARKASRTAEAYETWLDQNITQAGVHWILATVFIRFLEDNELIEVYLAGPGERGNQASDRREAYFQSYPTHSDRQYLESIFREVSQLPAMGKLFSEHNPLWLLPVSADGASKIISFWTKVDPDRGVLVHEFIDESLESRFLGDLYQDLSEATRKRYALLQTPDFVEEFILDRTLTPAIEEFGYDVVRLIDPACGSGHFLLGAFGRLYGLQEMFNPSLTSRELAQRALSQVYGVDVNPFAASIATFRLLIAALNRSGIRALKDAPNWRFNVAAGDSLLHGTRTGAYGGEATEGTQQSFLVPDKVGHVYEVEEGEELKRILGQRYHCVVANPPYITVKDSALSQEYRSRYRSCHRQYSLGVPFTERCFELAFFGHDCAGFVGIITANSFMKREFGKKLITEYIPKWDLTHVIDTSGAYLPGHGTPTVILVGRNRGPVSRTVRAVMGIRGEPVTPETPREGLVWTSIVNNLEAPGTTTPFVSVVDCERAMFRKHPWSIGGGGATDVMADLQGASSLVLNQLIISAGRVLHTGLDDVFYLPPHAATKYSDEQKVPLVKGEQVRDYLILEDEEAIFPYDAVSLESDIEGNTPLGRYLWRFRASLRNRLDFGRRPEELGMRWFEWMRFQKDRYRTPLSITFAFVASHNHFVLDRGGKVFNRSAPVIKLKEGATEEAHLELLGLLNSSTACFWGRQTFFPKGGFGSGKWEERLEWDGTKLKTFPVPATRPTSRAQLLDDISCRLQESSPRTAVEQGLCCTKDQFNEKQHEYERLFSSLVAQQEELDWECYGHYDLLDEVPLAEEVPPIALGQRAFEIVMARQVEEGELETSWFERHGSTPCTSIPEDWPEQYKEVVRRRIELIETDSTIGMLEQPEYKRRWARESWDDQLKTALRDKLLSLLEEQGLWAEGALQSVSSLADRVAGNEVVRDLLQQYTGRDDLELSMVLAELASSDAVPALPIFRYKESGLRKRAVWERTWELQREEDRTGTRLDIPVPPSYTSADFIDQTYWRLRGKLDVPKERFISFPHCERDGDDSLVIGWAGWDHLQQAQAIANYYQKVVGEGWSKERLIPLLASLNDLLPWLLQWHNEVDPTYGERLGDFYSEFLDSELRRHELTKQELTSWSPPKKVRRGGRKGGKAA